MKNVKGNLITCIILFFFVQICIATENNQKKVSINNEADWFDTDGNRIIAHGGGILKHGDLYYWYGVSYANNPKGYANNYGKLLDLTKMDPRPKGLHGYDMKTWEPIFDGFNVYSSPDLVNWENKGKAYPAPKKGWNRLHASHRPHVVYNDKTKKFVMIMYYYVYYPGCLLLVATADNPLGPFILHGAIETGSVSGHVGDSNIFKDKDGIGYIVYDDCTFNIRIDRLTDDFLSSHKDGIIVMERRQEAPAMVYCDGKYFVAGSAVQGWGLSPTSFAYADHPLGPYSHKALVETQETWQGQLTDMMYLPEADYILAVFDQWFHPDKEDINKSRQIFVPMFFDSETGKTRIDYREQWNPLNQ